MITERKGITVAGSLIADVSHQIDSYPPEGFLVKVRETALNLGGTGNIILDLAKLDKNLPIKVSALVGNEGRGEELIALLNTFPNIDTENIKVIDGQTPTVLVMNATDTKQRTFFCHTGAADLYSLDYIDWDKIDSKIFQLEYLLFLKTADSFDSEFGTHGARILYEAKRRGMLTSIDMVSEQTPLAKTVLTSALKYTDICCINELEAETATGISILENGELSKNNASKVLNTLKELGVSKWVVIHSKNFAVALDVENGDEFYLDSLDLPEGYIKGTTGAGDAYCSGILYAAHEDKPLREAMELARACAACSLSESNGTDGMREYSEVIKLKF
ncbi:MAG: carbohydrate kinase family protein [Clostridia bacterium]|nr:carbohydrate kinase family protein [Clostridia bacterium]